MTADTLNQSRIKSPVEMKVNIVFADLTHLGHACNAVPYGIALVAAYALEKLGSEIAVTLVKSPTELARHLDLTVPDMVCFSTYIWNTEISRAFASRIKERYPFCIIVFGGPNFPLNRVEQEKLLHDHPEIDFFVYREGEAAFFTLYQALKQHKFNADTLRNQGTDLPGCLYIHSGTLVDGGLPPRIESLDEIPSPYLTGLCDQFLEQGYTPVIQITRGCPFHCSFCQEGNDYFNPIKRYSVERVLQELWYLARRSVVKTLQVADSNFGMYDEDIEIARELSIIQKKLNWPTYFVGIGAKNNKKRALEAATLIKGAMLSAAIQSSDPLVLQNVKRQNVSLVEMIQMVSEQELSETHSFSEVILGLPGDTRQAHINSICELIDAGIHVVRSHQLIMLPGSEISKPEYRKQFGLQTRFRVMHNTAGSVLLFGNTFTAPEIDEICVASSTLTFQDYLECRLFDLTVEIFYNNGILLELNSFLKHKGFAISEFICRVHKQVYEHPVLKKLYDGFLDDTAELWETRDELTSFLVKPGILERYSIGELGRNEQLAYKSLAIFEHMDVLIEHAYHIASDMLLKSGIFTHSVRAYFDELQRFDLLRKRDPLSCEELRSGTFRYDFVTLYGKGFKVSPEGYMLKEDAVLLFQHSQEQLDFAKKARALLKNGLHGYAAIISSNPKIREYFRSFYAG
ncbi:MAG: radical SAM protein [Desulfuromonadales bacterium]